MGLLKRGYLSIEGEDGQGIKQGDLLNYSFKTNYNVGDDGGTPRHIDMHIKRNPGGAAILKLSTKDGSILKEDIGGDIPWKITLFKASRDTKVLTESKYVFDIEAYTTDDDTETFIDGHIKVDHEITIRDKS